MNHGLPPEQTVNWLAVLLPPRSFSRYRLTVGLPAEASSLRLRIGSIPFAGYAPRTPLGRRLRGETPAWLRAAGSFALLFQQTYSSLLT
jgi:hypothetical protein